MGIRDVIVEGSAEIVGDTCTLYVNRRSDPIVARVLGVVTREGAEDIYLDRLIHEQHQEKFCGFALSGAVTTILTRTC